ncbi:hypothetical protein HKD37_07G019568 [Glycine soja]
MRVPRKEYARSRHQRLFEENVGKTEKDAIYEFLSERFGSCIYARGSKIGEMLAAQLAQASRVASSRSNSLLEESSGGPKWAWLLFAPPFLLTRPGEQGCFLQKQQPSGGIFWRAQVGLVAICTPIFTKYTPLCFFLGCGMTKFCLRMSSGPPPLDDKRVQNDQILSLRVIGHDCGCGMTKFCLRMSSGPPPLDDKRSPVESPTVATYPSAGGRRVTRGMRVPRKEYARSRHQRLFEENVGKTGKYAIYEFLSERFGSCIYARGSKIGEMLAAQLAQASRVASSRSNSLLEESSGGPKSPSGNLVPLDLETEATLRRNRVERRRKLLQDRIMASRKRKNTASRPTAQYDTRYSGNILSRNILPERNVKLYHIEFDEFKVELERRNPYKCLANLQDGSIDVALVKEFYANLYTTEDQAPKQARTPVVLEEGESLPTYSRFCRLRIDHQEIEAKLCIPRKGVFSYSNLAPTSHTPYLNMDRARLVYGLVTNMDMNIGALILGQISFIAPSNSSRVEFPALITTLCRARGLTSEGQGRQGFDQLMFHLLLLPSSFHFYYSYTSSSRPICLGLSAFESMLQSLHQGQILLMQNLQVVAPPGSILTIEQFMEKVSWPGTLPSLEREGGGPSAQVPQQVRHRSTKAGLLLLRTLHRRGNQTYVVLFKGESSDSFYLEGDHFKALDLKNDPFTFKIGEELANQLAQASQVASSRSNRLLEEESKRPKIFLQKAVASGGSNLAPLGELGGNHLPYFAINRGGSEEEKGRLLPLEATAFWRKNLECPSGPGCYLHPLFTKYTPLLLFLVILFP